AGAGAPGAFTGLQVLAVDSTGDVIVVAARGGDPADGATSSVLRYSASGQYESTIGPVPQAATVAVRPDDDSFVVSGVQDAVNHDAAPSLTWFDASDALLQNVDVNAGDDGRRVMYATISGLAIGAGADGRLYMASDVSRGSYVNQYGVASLQAFEHNVSTAPVIHPSSFTVTDVTDRTARLEAALNPKASETTYHVEYGPTTSYGASTPATSAGAGPSYVSKAQNLVGLTPSTTYHYKVVAQNGIGVSESPDRTFTTAHERPTITVGAVADVTRSTASVPVTINTHGLTGTVFATIAQTNGSYAGLTVPIALAAADAPQETVIGMAGLPAGGTFIVRVKATSGAGLTTTPEFTFATQAPPGYVPRPGGTPDGGNWYDALRSDQGAVPAPGAPSNRFTLKSKVAGTSLALTVGVPGKGTLTASGSQLGSVIKRPAIKGDVRLTLRLTAAGRAALKRAKSKQLRTRVTVRFTPSGGAVHAVTRTITFKRGGAR
ncbi:MAG: fibronectin type III domain-containing protein, partial [Baekduia sp.]